MRAGGCPKTATANQMQLKSTPDRVSERPSKPLAVPAQRAPASPCRCRVGHRRAQSPPALDRVRHPRR
eukprot:14080331-Alexandrium_andersonii.AAC.1